MTLEELNLEMKKLVGEQVVAKQIICNAIVLYFFGTHGDAATSIFIAAPWRYLQQGEIIVGSKDFTADEKSFMQMSSLTLGLEGAVLEDCEVNPETSDLELQFSGSQVVRNFAHSAFNEVAWVYQKRHRKLTAHVSPLGIRIEGEDWERGS